MPKQPTTRLPRRDFLKLAASGTAALAAARSWGGPEPPAAARLTGPVAHLEIVLDEPIGTINPNVYGHFTEHIGGVVYDGIWVGPDSKVPNIGGIRRALIEHLQRINPPVIRWPGGCFADRYHWRDGIGPIEKRPRRYGRWEDVTESNHFGTHEFMRFCRLVKAEPYFAANVGTGTPEEFQQWVEYCNAPTDSTSLAAERAANGDREPLGVRYWGVGNESWGCGGQFPADVYCDRYRQFATWVPGYRVPLFLIASGPNGNDLNWTRTFFERFLRGPSAPIHGWSPHYYCGTTGHALQFDGNDWYEMLRKGAFMETLVREQWDALVTFDPNHKIKLIVDEWGCWHPKGTEINPKHLFEQMITLRDAMVTALTLDIFNRNAEKVAMANVAQLINNLHTLFLADEDKFVATPNFHVYEMYQPHRRGRAVRLNVAAPSIKYQFKGKDEEIFRVAGSASVRDETLTLTVVHTHVDEPGEAEIVIRGGTIRVARQTVLTHKDIHAHNTFEKPNVVVPKSAVCKLKGGRVTFTFAARSITRLDLTLG
jgi:alpha-N-arabinofuranosidase